MAVNYLQDYLGIDPNDYSAMEQGIAGISPLVPGQSIIPQAPVMPRASIMDEGDFASATAPLMDRVYQREAEGRERAEGLTNELQALQEEMAQTSEAEIQKRADLERQIQNIMQERDTSRTSAEDLANQLQGLQSNLQEVTELRDIATQDYQDAVAQQDIIRQQAAENQAIQLEEQRNSLLEEREGIITTLEQDFGVQRSELESVIGGLEGQVGDLTSKVGELESVRGSLEGQINDLSSQMQNLETEKQDALAQQDIIRAESAQAQQDALAQQGEQFATEKSALEQQIADLTAQVGQQQAPVEPPVITDIEDRQEIPPRPPQLPPKIDDQIFIDDRPIIDERIGMPPPPLPPITPPTREKLLPPTIMPPLPPQIGRPPLRREKPIPLRPREELIDEGFIPPEKIGRPPREDIVPIRNQDDFLPRLPIQQPPQKPISIGGVGGGRGIIGKNPIIGSGTGGIGARPDLPPPTTGGFKPFFGSKKPTKVPMKPPSIGGFGGMSGRRSMRPMMRAGGGTISQAIADLQNRLR